jgi:phosphoribosylformimino-5-aminoimidazole carboxamide ribotide isomerase
MIKIMPIYILGVKCVRLTLGDFSSRKVYNDDPLDVALEIEDNGLKYIHVVDLDGAREKHVVNYKILEKIAARTSLLIDFGGGIRSDEDLRIAFNSGAKQVTAGSIAVTDSSRMMEWLKEYGNEKIILGADFIGDEIATHGWTEKSDKKLISFISDYFLKGVKYVICTDVDKDGMMKGPATEMYKKILENAKVNLIASGGISSLKDIEDIRETGCEGAIIGKAVYEGKIKLKELEKLC